MSKPYSDAIIHAFFCIHREDSGELIEPDKALSTSRYSLIPYGFNSLLHQGEPPILMQFRKWHGRPAREITRKMRVPQSNCTITQAAYSLDER